MAEAEVGDDVYQEDPTVIKEQLAAEITGQRGSLIRLFRNNGKYSFLCSLIAIVEMESYWVIKVTFMLTKEEDCQP